MTLGESLGTGADAASLLLPLPALLEDGARAEPLSLALPADPGVEVAGVCEGALPEALGLDADGAGAESVIGEARGTTEVLPGVVPGEDGGTGTSLCMHICTVFSRNNAVVVGGLHAGEYVANQGLGAGAVGGGGEDAQQSAHHSACTHAHPAKADDMHKWWEGSHTGSLSTAVPAGL